MITSPTPWAYKIIDGFDCIVDAHGCRILTLEDYSNAELIIKRVNEHAHDVALLDKEFDDLVGRLEEVKAKLVRE